MECTECGKPMVQEEVLTSRTTSPDEDDQYQLMWVCDCGATESLDND